jgi:hypothetical protein
MEILGLLGLLELEADDPRSQNLSNFLIKFINTNPGTAHLISDRWAVSLIPPVLILGREGNAQLARRLLENVIRWVADRYGSDSRETARPAAGAAVRGNAGREFLHLVRGHARSAESW